MSSFPFMLYIVIKFRVVRIKILSAQLVSIFFLYWGITLLKVLD